MDALKVITRITGQKPVNALNGIHKDLVSNRSFLFIIEKKVEPNAFVTSKMVTKRSTSSASQWNLALPPMQ